jgi:hypothetical protein
MPYTDDSDAFSQEINSFYNQYRIEKGLPLASPLECANRLANSIDWAGYTRHSDGEIVVDQFDIAVKGREECPELSNASFFLAIVRSPTTGPDTFGKIDNLTPNGVAGWSYFGVGRDNYRGGYRWSLVLVDPSGNNGGSGAQSNTDQVSAQGFQGSWDQAASTMYDIWGSHGGI